MAYIPAWVYVLFFLLLYIGIKRCYTRVISLGRLALIPAFFIFFGLHSTLQMFGISASVLSLLILGAGGGLLIGHYWVRKNPIVADKQNRLIQIPGDVSLLIMLLMIFSIEFFIHYSMDVHLVVVNSAWFKPFAILATGFVAGISIGMNVAYFLKYLRSTSVNLATAQ